MSAASGQLLPASISDSASFFTRLRHSSFISAVLVRPGRLFALELEGLVERSSPAPWSSSADRILHALAIALLEAREDHIRGLDLARNGSCRRTACGIAENSAMSLARK